MTQKRMKRQKSYNIQQSPQEALQPLFDRLAQVLHRGVLFRAAFELLSQSVEIVLVPLILGPDN